MRRSQRTRLRLATLLGCDPSWPGITTAVRLLVEDRDRWRRRYRLVTAEPLPGLDRLSIVARDPGSEQ